MDRAAKSELELYLDNTYELYNQKKSIIANVKRRLKSGKYDPKLAPKLWLYWVDAGAKRYVKEFGGTVQTMFPKPLRESLAKDLAAQYEKEIRAGEHGAVGGTEYTGQGARLKSGYAYQSEGRGGWKESPDDDWDTVAITPDGTETTVGRRRIDGATVIVFRWRKKFYAQTTASLGVSGLAGSKRGAAKKAARRPPKAGGGRPVTKITTRTTEVRTISRGLRGFSWGR